MTKDYKKTLKILIILASIFLVAFLVIAIILAVNNFKLPIDDAITQWAYDIRGERGGAFYWFNRIITEFGHLYITLVVVLIVGIIWKFKIKTLFFTATILLSFILQKLIKFCVARPRPNSDYWWMNETSTSFPSGHSITVACVFTLLIMVVIFSPNIRLWIKYLLCTLFSSIILLVPFSRIILGVHYFTDVLAGVCFGVFIAIIGVVSYIYYVNHYKQKIEEKV